VASLLIGTAISSAAHAQATAEPQEVSSQIARLQALIEGQSAQLARQEAEIADQRVDLNAQQGLLKKLQLSGTDLAISHARGEPTDVVVASDAADPAAGPAGQVAPVAGAPVGEAPPPGDNRIIVASLPEANGVLTPSGHWVIEPSVSYTHGSSNRLVFRGVEIVTGFQIGVIDANDVDQNLTSGALDVRYGLTSRIELEARVPYVYRTDRAITLAQMQDQVTQTAWSSGSDIGDVEVSARYQINNGANGWPVLIAGLRAKSNTGSSPYGIDRDESGVATKAATGSGFWGYEPSISLLYPSDPVVIFANLSYFGQVARDIDRPLGNVDIGRVDPGGSIGASAGFGFALNPRFSFSLGYRHNYIFPTKTELKAPADIDYSQAKSTSLQVGAFTFGWSFQLTSRLTLSNTYEIGTTRDAPDMSFAFRLPYRF
jgi:hypothetical protein